MRYVFLLTLALCTACPTPLASDYGKELLFPDEGKAVLIFDSMTLRERCRFDDHIIDVFDVTNADGQTYTLGQFSRESLRTFALRDDFSVGIYLNGFHSKVPDCPLEKEAVVADETTLRITDISMSCGVDFDLLSTTNHTYIFSNEEVVCGIGVSSSAISELRVESIQGDLDNPSAYRDIPSVPCLPIEQWKAYTNTRFETCMGEF